MKKSLSLLLLSLLSLLPSISCSTTTSLSQNPTPYAVETNPTVVVKTVDGKPGLYVDGEEFIVRGIAYSPVPVLEDVYTTGSLGDLFTLDYAYLWQRDFPLIKAAGFNVLRIYYWTLGEDHTPFLDAAHSVGLKVMPTFFIGDVYAYGHINTTALQKQKIQDFYDDVARYGDHPAILMWIYGNELNGYWNGFLDDFDVTNCNGTWWPGTWKQRSVYRGSDPCFYGSSSPSDTTCTERNFCVYGALFDWIDEAIVTVSSVTSRPITTAFSDVDNIIAADYSTSTGEWRSPALDLNVNLGDRLSHMDIWSVNAYVGKNIDKVLMIPFAQEMNSSKLLLISETGVDSYNDECGWTYYQVCPNSIYGRSDGSLYGGSVDNSSFVGCGESGEDCNSPGETVQSDWDVHLIKVGEQHAFYSDNSNSVSIGSVLMSWVDEYWKGENVQAYCEYPCSATTPDGMRACLNSSVYNSASGSAGCGAAQAYTHVTCGQQDLSVHDICGYANGGFPDSYVNEQWFGVSTPTSCGISVGDGNTGYHLDAISTRQAYRDLGSYWGSSSSSLYSTYDSCNKKSFVYQCWECSSQTSLDDLYDGACVSVCPITLASFNGSTSLTGTDPGLNGTSFLLADSDNSSSSTGSADNSSSSDSSSGSSNSTNSTGTDAADTDDGAASSSAVQNSLLVFVMAAILTFWMGF